ncbi:MAG: hypothetical protein M3081_01975 [Gemmatimonadota bacterium]|nr:hypothetical protein [Gemmatimonadota bacterium]
MLSSDYWTTALGGGRSIVGRVVTVSGASLAVVGVVSPEFRGMHIGAAPAIWVPIHVWPLIAPSSMRESTLESRNWEWISVVGRSGAGMTLAQVHSAVATAIRSIDPTGVTWTSNPLLASDMDREGVTISGYAPRAGERVSIEWNIVGAHYHEVMGIPMVSGRGLTSATGCAPCSRRRSRAHGCSASSACSRWSSLRSASTASWRTR